MVVTWFHEIMAYVTKSWVTFASQLHTICVSDSSFPMHLLQIDLLLMSVTVSSEQPYQRFQLCSVEDTLHTTLSQMCLFFLGRSQSPCITSLPF
jgi:hypothetical protein